MSWVVVIGAGPSQVPYIHMLKAWGYSVFATDVDPTAPGFAHTDDHAVVSTYDVEGTWMALQSHRDLQAISAIISPTTGEPLRTVHKLSRRLGLPALKSETVEDLLHKGRLRARLNETAERPLAWGIATTFPEAEQVARGIGYPVIIKPARGGMGGRGVTAIFAPEDLLLAFSQTQQAGLDDQVVVEALVGGTELSVTALLLRGELQFFTVGLSISEDGFLSIPVGEAMGPRVLSKEIQERIERVFIRTCASIGLETCPLNIDVILDREGVPHILEIEFALADALVLAPLAMEYDLVANALRVYLGLPPGPVGSPQQAAALRYFMHPSPEAKRITGLEAARNLEGVVELNVAASPRVIRETPAGRRYTWGHVVTRERTQEAAITLTKAVYKHLSFEYEK